MKLKGRRKSERFRGSHTHGRGGKKKARGSGHRGGFGMAGTGKRGDQRKTLILKNTIKEKYFGKRQTRLWFGKPKFKELNLSRISEGVKSLISHGLAKEHNGAYELNIKNYKVIGFVCLIKFIGLIRVYMSCKIIWHWAQASSYLSRH